MLCQSQWLFDYVDAVAADLYNEVDGEERQECIQIAERAMANFIGFS
jgi:hypothetical protein